MQSKLLFISPVLLSVLSFASIGEASECTTDAECAPNFHCELAPSAGSGSSPGSSGNTTPQGATATDLGPNAPSQPATTPGSSAGSVGEDSASDDSAGDSKVNGVSTGGSTGNAGAPPPDTLVTPGDPTEPPAAEDESEEEPSIGANPTGSPETPRGWCEPSPIDCETDADCPEPTYCGDNGECQIKLVLCEADSACDANYACVDLGSQGQCSSGDPGPGGMTDGSDARPDVDSPPSTNPAGASVDGPEQPGANEDPSPGGDPLPLPPDSAGDVVSEPECTPPEPVRVCFPAPVACATDSVCVSGWTCEDVTKLHLQAFEGIERACLPPGWTAVKDDHVNLDEESEHAIGSVRGEADNGGEPTAGGDPSPIPENPLTPTDDSTVALGTQGGSEGTASGSNGGCSMALGGGGTQSPGGSNAWLALIGLAFSALRRGARSQRG